jgi:cold shock CspA family protein
VSGTVKWFEPMTRGWGFVTTPDGRDAFLHYRHLRCSRHELHGGTRVTFTIIEGEARLQTRSSCWWRNSPVGRSQPNND